MTVLVYPQPNIQMLTPLINSLLSAKTKEEKCVLLRDSFCAKAFLNQFSLFERALSHTAFETQLLILSLLAIGEGANVLRGWESIQDLPRSLEKIGMVLQPIETFYDMLGGIVGYHVTFLKLLEQKEGTLEERVTYQQPPKLDLIHDSSELRKAIYWGIKSLPILAEIYPVGGAGDRLNLLDAHTGESLPAGVLPFCGKTLFSLLIRDLEGREFIYKKFFGQKQLTPIILMTSDEKKNDEKVRKILEQHQWFGRPKELFYFINQPLVPVLTKEGHWSMKGVFNLNLKPGGHGVLWKLMHDQGAFDWLKKQGRKKALVRQINNPIAGTDYGLLAFLGYGCAQDKQFGFAACPRLLHTAEGTNVLVEKIEKGEHKYSLSNVEYTDFVEKGIQDEPATGGSPYSCFPANTNILFVDLPTVEQTVPLCPVPGMLINLKNDVPYVTPEGEEKKIKGGRLESTMQNISDALIFNTSHRLDPKDCTETLPVFLTYGERGKTISVTKCAYKGSGKIEETPEGCFYQIMSNNRVLLQSCGIVVPQEQTEESFLQKGPNLLFLFHPSLGPIYRIIQQKIRGGKIKSGSEIQLEIAELELDNLNLEGSLIIEGDVEKSRCRLKDVSIVNKGIDREAANVYWENRIKRKGFLRIILEGSAEFEAEEVVFSGTQEIRVAEGVRCIAYQEGDQVMFREEKISSPTWNWNYQLDQEERIILYRQNLKL